MQADAQLWSDSLFQSGGRLELPKYGFHTTYFDFNKEGNSIMRHKPEQDIIIKNEHKEETIIKNKNIYTPRKKLGHHKSPAGHFQTQTKEAMKKAKTISEANFRTKATQDQARMMYETVYRPAVEFTLTQSFLSESQLQQIEQKTLPRIYAKCGYNRYTAKVTLQGPRKLGGTGFTPLRVAAGAGSVVHFLRHWRTPKEETGKL